MKFSYQLKRSCGNVYGNGNVIFASNGNIALAPIGNRINVFDLIHQTTETLPIQTKKDIAILCLSHNDKFLVAIDEDGFGYFFHFTRRLLLHQFNFRQRVYCIKFCWNDEYFAVTHGKGCQIWKTPSAVREFVPLRLLKNISGSYDETITLDWSSNSKHLIVGSKDLTCRVYFYVPTNYMTLCVLIGHRDQVLGAYFSHDDRMAFSIAGDGGVFVWEYSRITIPADSKATPSKAIKRKLPSEELIEEDNDTSDEQQTDDEEEEGEDAGFQSKQKHKNDPSTLDEMFATNGEKKDGKVKVSRKGNYRLLHRHLLRDNQQGEITCTTFHKASNLLILGFAAGILGIYEMPDCTNVHRLSVSNNPLSSISINPSGEWIAMGIAGLGQLLIWEWKSESYILKQQGHSYGLNVLDISAEGQFIATGGDDGKVKIWNSFTGFCIVTFKEHLGPVTGVKFIGQGQGKAILSSSLDGTIRAHDLLRYKNFRTLTAPLAVQFTSLTADQSGEIVCAGSQDPFQIYVWSLQTGKLLEVLTGHEGPIACLTYDSATSTLASGSWDGTLKLWNIYNSTCIETFEHGCDVLAIAFRNDGKELACTAADGNIYIWNPDSGEQTKIIEGRRDLAGGRVTTDRKSKENATKSKFFNSVSYSADGNLLLAGGKSKYLCMYCIESGALLRKFQLSHNRSLEGIVDRLRSDRLIDGVSVDNLNVETDSSKVMTALVAGNKRHAVPGVAQHHQTNLSSNAKLLHPEIMTYAVQFSNTGKEFAVVSTEGLQIFSLDHHLQFLPMELDISITAESARQLFENGDYINSLQMGLVLADFSLLQEIIEKIPIDLIEAILKNIDPKYMKHLLVFLAERLEKSKKLEFYVRWILGILQNHYSTMQRLLGQDLSLQEGFRSVLRALLTYEKELLQLVNKNSHMLAFFTAQLTSVSSVQEASQSLPLGGLDEIEREEEVEEDMMDIDRNIPQIHGNVNDSKGEEDIGAAVEDEEDFGDMVLKSAWIDDDDDDEEVIDLSASNQKVTTIHLSSNKKSKNPSKSQTAKKPKKK